MKNIFLFIILSVILFNSCASFKDVEYKPIFSLNELNGIYVDTVGDLKTDDRVSYSLDYIIERDTADIYQYQFIDNKNLKISALTEKGFQATKIYKGKYNKKGNYFEITIEKKILPLIILNSYLNIKERIGKDENDNLLIDYRHESFGMLVPLGASNYDYQTTSNLVKLRKDEYIPSKLNSKFGYANSLGDILIEPKYDFARVFKNDVARVKVDGKWGLIDKKGNYIFEPQFDYISAIYQDSVAYVLNGNYRGLINKNGNEILPIKGLELNGFSKLGANRYHVYKNQKEGIYNSLTKSYVIEPIYDKIGYPKRYSEWEENYVKPYFILSLNNQKAILVDDALVVPLTPKMYIDDIYSFYPQSNYFTFAKIADKKYVLNIDFSKSSITLDDIYPFYLKVNNRFYIVDRKKNYYELLREKETFKSVLSLKNPRAYIENNPLTYEDIINLPM